MTVYAEFNPTAIRAGDFPMLSRPIILASGANASGVPLPRGSVLGQITASKKYILSLSAASDGSQVPKAVLAADTDASAADTTCPAYFTGEFADLMCNFGTGHSQATVDAAFRDAGVSMFIRTVGLVA